MKSVRHPVKLFTLALTGLLSLNAGMASAQANWNAKGDYQPADQSPAYLSWRVVDPDPNGLNCRMANPYRSIDFESQRPGSSLVADNKHNIGNWPIRVTIPRNTLLTAPLMDFRGGKLPILVRDVNGRPWLPLMTYQGQCFVRANSRYIQPIPASAQRLPRG